MSRNPCKHCGRQAQLFLCELCIKELREMLTWLARGRKRPDGDYEAGWLEHLAEAALGQTKLGESARRTPRYRRRLDGDKSLASQIEAFPNDKEENLDEARRQRQRAALQHALGSARINLRASELLAETYAVLLEWVREICADRGTEIPFRTEG